MIDGTNCTVWDPWNYFRKCADEPYGILILNNKIRLPFEPTVLLHMWNNASVRVTVDGGTEQWLKWLVNNDIVNAVDIDLITGDMDSITSKTMDFVRKTSTVVLTEDQNETDFTKALKELSKFMKQKEILIKTLITVDDSSGRLDKIMANINTLFKGMNILPSIKHYKLAEDSLTWLLPKGQHLIHVPDSILAQRKWCALMPIGHPCTVTTLGLKWNLHKAKLVFGSIVSTSNTYSGDKTISIETDEILLWSMCIENLLK